MAASVKASEEKCKNRSGHRGAGRDVLAAMKKNGSRWSRTGSESCRKLLPVRRHHHPSPGIGQGVVQRLAHIVHKRLVQHSFTAVSVKAEDGVPVWPLGYTLCSTGRTIQLTHSEQERRRWAF
jgi:hypothetical protein